MDKIFVKNNYNMRKKLRSASIIISTKNNEIQGWCVGADVIPICLHATSFERCCCAKIDGVKE